jgi:hypothetical protein
MFAIPNIDIRMMKQTEEDSIHPMDRKHCFSHTFFALKIRKGKTLLMGSLL